MSTNIISGRVWKFGDNINTDLMLPGDVHAGSEEEQARAVFRANRPGWLQEMARGDLIVGGRNYGTGSSRPAPRSLRNIGIACLVADSINSLFFRNCVNFAFPAIECPGVHEAFEEGDVAEVDFESAVVRNVTRGVTLSGRPMPPRLMELVKAGGIYPLLEKEGLIAPKA